EPAQPDAGANSTGEAPAIDTPIHEIAETEERPSVHAAPYSAMTSAGAAPPATESAASPRTLAMLIAAIIILVTGGIRLLELGVFAVQQGNWDAPGPSVMAMVLYILCGIGLLRGSQRARKVMLVLAVLGAVASLLAPLVESFSITWLHGILQTMWL